ncbi:MAG: response regulator transcription factor [Puia sp.]|nr:response regulator transcription factor [Puia sp.]
MTGKTPIKAAIVDDHLATYEPLMKRIEEYGTIQFTFLAESGEVLKERLTAGNVPDVLIMDIYMPDIDGFQLVGWLKQHYPTINVVAFTILSSELAMIRLLLLGGDGYIIKGVRPRVLADAIETVVQTGSAFTHISAGLLVKFIRDDGFDVQKFWLQPEGQNFQFITLACSELTYCQIASIMKVPQGTLERIRERVFEIFKVKTRVGLTLAAIRHGIVSPGYEQKTPFTFI